jgi:hypothetical protein
MEMSRFKKRTAVVLGVIGALVLGGVAFAFWTNTGSGTGSASTATNSSITVNQTSPISGLAPGKPAQTLSGDFDNPNDTPVFVSSVTAAVTETDQAGCDETDYTIAGSATVNAEVDPGNGEGSWSGLTIQFNNKAGTNQNACKNAAVTIAYTAN